MDKAIDLRNCSFCYEGRGCVDITLHTGKTVHLCPKCRRDLAANGLNAEDRAAAQAVK